MKKIITLTKAMLLNNFRQFETVFWTVLFPSVFFLFFNALFGGLSENSSFSSRISVYYEESLIGISKTVYESVFTGIDGEIATIEYLDSKEDGIKKLQNKETDLFIIFPKGFNGLNAKMIIKTAKVPPIELYYTSKSDSTFAKQIFNSINDEINIRFNNNGQDLILTPELISVNSKTERELKYKDFLFPGILMMSLMTISIFNLPINIINDSENGTLKRLNVAPVKMSSYFLAFIFTNLVIIILSLIIFYLEGYFLNVNPNIFKIEFFGFLLYSIITILSIGLLLTSFFKKVSTVAVASNIVYQITMFLSGLFFYVKSTPWFIRWYVYFNPATYMVDGLRNVLLGRSVGLINYIIPGIWFIIALIIFSFKFKKVMRGE